MNERQTIEQAIAAVLAQRSALGDATTDAAVSGLRQRLAALERSGGGAIAPATLAGERKLVTVMFADLSGFTALSEEHDPEHVRAKINACFDCLVPVISRYEGTVDKFIGDEVMALFGAPMAREDDAERGLRAALEMMEALAAFNARQGTTLAMHVGISTGLVVAGGLGSEGRQQYSVMGDAVNLASRLEHASEEGEILVGPNTVRLTAPLFDFEALPPLSVKGKALPVAAFRLRGAKAVPGSTRGIAGLQSPLVGRSSEFECLVSIARAAAEGRGAIVALTGEPGLGKSRLVAEVRRATEGLVRWGESRAQSYTSGMSYAMVRNLLDGLLGIAADAPPSNAALSLRAGAEAVFDGEALVEHLPYLARLQGVALDDDADARVRGVLPEAIQGRMRRAFAELIRALARPRPLALVFEDLHWADPSSLGALEALLPLVGDVPLLLLIVYRSQEGGADEWYRAAVANRAHVLPTVELAPLAEHESETLVANLLQIDDVPADMRRLVLSRAEGNPFFLEELLRSLIDAGAVLSKDGYALAGPNSELAQIPDTLHGVIAARIDRLPPDDKRALQTAAVIGRVFQRPVLGRVLETERPDELLDEHLEDLARRELIRRRLDLAYIFKHAITQDVTYNGLLIARRKVLHRATAEAIEALYPEQAEPLAAALAYHYERADAPERAIHYLTLAADRDRRTHSNAEAISFYRAALAQAESHASLAHRAAHLYESLGDVLFLTGRHDEAREAYADARARVPSADRIGQSRLHRKEGGSWMPTRQYAKALEAYLQAEEVLGPAPGGSNGADTLEGSWRAAWLEIQLERVYAHYWAHEVDAMAALIDRVRPVVEAHAAPIRRAKFVRCVVMMMWRRDRMMSDEALQTTHRGVAAARESGDAYEIALATLMLGLSHLWRTELEPAESHLREALKIAEHIGDAERQVLCFTYLTVTFRRRGDVAATREWAKRSQEAASAARMPLYVGHGHANLAWAAWATGEFADVHRHADAAVASWGEVPNPTKLLAYLPMATLALHENRLARAIELLRALVPPPEMQLPPELVAAIGAAIEAWDASNVEDTRRRLSEVVEAARRSRWL